MPAGLGRHAVWPAVLLQEVRNRGASWTEARPVFFWPGPFAGFRCALAPRKTKPAPAHAAESEAPRQAREPATAGLVGPGSQAMAGSESKKVLPSRPAHSGIASAQFSDKSELRSFDFVSFCYPWIQDSGPVLDNSVSTVPRIVII